MLGNGDLIPDIVKKEEEEEEEENIKEEDIKEDIKEITKIEAIDLNHIHFIKSDDSDDMFEEEREIDLSDVPISQQLMFLHMA